MFNIYNWQGMDYLGYLGLWLDDGVYVDDSFGNLVKTKSGSIGRITFVNEGN